MYSKCTVVIVSFYCMVSVFSQFYVFKLIENLILSDYACPSHIYKLCLFLHLRLV